MPKLKRTVLLGAVLCLILTAAGCGGSGSGNSASTGGGFTTAKAIIQKMQSKGLTCVSQDDKSGQLYSKDGWGCNTTSDGGSVDAYLFSDNTNRDNWLKIAQKFGGNFVLGNKWIVACDTCTGQSGPGIHRRDDQVAIGAGRRDD